MLEKAHKSIQGIIVQCVEKIEGDSKTALEGDAILGLSRLSSGAGKIVEKIPVISKSQLDENLLKAEGILQTIDTNRTQDVLSIFADSQTNYADSLIENIHAPENLSIEKIN